MKWITCASLVILWTAALSATANQDDSRSSTRKIKRIKSGRETVFKCQLYDGSHWSACVWKHGDKSARVERDSNQSSSEPYDGDSGRVVIEAGFSECNLRVRNVSKWMDEGVWTCTVTKTVNGASWSDRTSYDVQVQQPPQITINPLNHQLTAGIAHSFDCKVRHGNMKPVEVSVVRKGGVVIAQKTFDPKLANDQISSDDEEFTAQLVYTPTVADAFGKTKLRCRVGTLKKSVPFPEILFKPQLVNSSFDASQCDQDENNINSSSIVRLVFRANPLPNTQQVYLLIANPLNSGGERIKYRDSIVLLPENEKGRLVVLVNTTTTSSQTTTTPLQVENEVGGTSIDQIQCNRGGATSGDQREITLAIGCSIGAVLVVLILLLLWLSFSRRKCCFANGGRGTDLSGKPQHCIVIEETSRGRRQPLNRPDLQLEHTSFPVTKMTLAPTGHQFLNNNPLASHPRDHEYEEIPAAASANAAAAANDPRCSGYLKADATPLPPLPTAHKDGGSENRARQDSGFETNSETDKASANAANAAAAAAAAALPLPPTLPPPPPIPAAGQQQQQWGSYERNPFKSGDLAGRPPKARAGGASSSDLMVDLTEFKQPNDMSENNVNEDGVSLDGGSGDEYNKLDFDRAKHDLRTHYQSTETLKPIRYSTQI